MIAWVKGPLTQDLVDRLLVWRTPVWRWYLETDLDQVQERPEVVRLLGEKSVWLWTPEPPSPDQALLAQHFHLAGWVWDNPPTALPWSVDAVRAIGYALDLRLATYVNAGHRGLRRSWVEWVLLSGVEVVPYWSRYTPEVGDLTWVDLPGVRCPAGLREVLRNYHPGVPCHGPTCLYVQADRITGCRWCGSAGTVAREKAEALEVLESDVAHCGGCLTPWPHWDKEWRQGADHGSL